MARNFLFYDAGVGRLDKAWQAKFGVAREIPGWGMTMFPGHGHFGTVLTRIVDFPGGLKATIDGDIAQVRIPLPRDAFISPGSDKITALGRWSGAILIFKQVGGNWKLDTDRTFTFVSFIHRKPGNNDGDLAILQKLGAKLADGLDMVAGDIESGDLATPEAAVDEALTNVLSPAIRDAHVDGCDTMLLPVIGG